MKNMLTSKNVIPTINVYIENIKKVLFDRIFEKALILNNVVKIVTMNVITIISNLILIAVISFNEKTNAPTLTIK